MREQIRDNRYNLVCMDGKIVSDKQLMVQYKVCEFMDESELKLPANCQYIDIDTWEDRMSLQFL